MKNYIIILFCLSLFILPYTIWAQEPSYPKMNQGIDPASFERVGMSGWQFLKLPTSARYAAMGGVTSSISRGDAGAALGNPASIADVKNISISVNNMTWLVDTKYQSYSVVKNFGKFGFIGLHAIYLDYGDMIRTENQPIYDNGAYTGRAKMALNLGTVGANDMAIGISYARQITNKLQLGGNLRFVQETLDDAKTSNWSLDIGTIYYTGFKSLRFAMMGRNYGPDTEFADYDERIGFPAVKVKMPMSFQLGAAIDLLEGGENNPHLWTVSAEFVHPNDGPEKVNLGTEYSFMNFAMLRAGYRLNYDEEGLSLGGGLRLVTSAFAVSINYAFIDFGRFDAVHIFTLGLGL